MTLIFKNHSHHYELECVAKLFFPCERFQHAFNPEIDPEGDRIITRQKKGKHHTFLLVVAELNGSLHRTHKAVRNESADKASCERLICTALYELLTKVTGISVEWGILTGIRPVKQMNYLLLRDVPKSEVRRVFQQDYLVSAQKLALCEQVSDAQLEMIRTSAPESYSLYVAIPFCPSRCSYCSFVSSSITNHKARALIAPYVNRLCEELEVIAGIVQPLGLKLESIYIGGGTPAVLSAGQMKQLTDTIRTHFLKHGVREYTIEAGRADVIDAEKLRVMKQSGATRISINPQTFSDAVLKEIGRNHSVQDVLHSYDMAKQAGFDDINMDLIAGLPGDTLESFCRTMDEAVRLSPTNLTVHTLSIKRSSSLYTADGLDGRLKQADTARMVDYACRTLTKNGYHPYYLYRQKNTLDNLENVGYCKPGYEGLYNVFIMEEVHTILAAGAGGVCKLIRPDSVKVKRVFNYKYPYEYLDHFDEVLRRKQEIAEFYRKNS